MSMPMIFTVLIMSLRMRVPVMRVSVHKVRRLLLPHGSTPTSSALCHAAHSLRRSRVRSNCLILCGLARLCVDSRTCGEVGNEVEACDNNEAPEDSFRFLHTRLVYRT